MKYLIPLLLAIAASTAHAVTVPCWPSVAAPPVIGKIDAEPGVFYAAWQCPPDQMFFFTFTPTEALPWFSAAATGTLDTAAANSAALVAVPLTSAEQAVFRAVGVNQGWNPPKALSAIAYKQRQAVDGFTYVAIGSVPIDTLCTMQGQAGDYMPVPRSAVKLASKFDTLPLVTYARCG